MKKTFKFEIEFTPRARQELILPAGDYAPPEVVIERLRELAALHPTGQVGIAEDSQALVMCYESEPTEDEILRDLQCGFSRTRPIRVIQEPHMAALAPPEPKNFSLRLLMQPGAAFDQIVLNTAAALSKSSLIKDLDLLSPWMGDHEIARRAAMIREIAEGKK